MGVKRGEVKQNTSAPTFTSAIGLRTLLTSIFLKKT